MPRFESVRPVACAGCGVVRPLHVSVVDRAEPSADRWDMWWEVILNDGRHVPRVCPSCQSGAALVAGEPVAGEGEGQPAFAF